MHHLELKILPPACRPHEKLMGQVLVPAAHRQSCEFQAVNPAEAAALRQLLQGRGQGAAAAAAAAEATAAVEGGGGGVLASA